MSMDMEVFEKLEARVDALISQLQERGREMDRLQKTLAERDDTIKALQHRLEASDQERTAIRSKIDTVLAKIEAHEQVADTETTQG